jgi:predicted dehydrogenase
MKQHVRFAVVGAGGFARFAVSQFIKRDGADLIGVYDQNRDSIAALQADHASVKVFASLDDLLSDADVDLVYIGSPPFLHYEQSLAALRAGKHVICEKPAAIELSHAQQLRQVAQDNSLLFVVNLMQRYNPLYDAVKILVDQQLLGQFVHGYFENYASDEFLPAAHWFWDDSKSGGIFIEHGVHFFDMFSGWLGKGEVTAAQRLSRRGHPEIWDIAQCEVIYPSNAPVHFFHAFNQPKVLDRQQLRIQFERGDITLHEWVPNRLVLHAVCTRAEVDRLETLFPAASVTVLSEWDTVQHAQGRFKAIKYDRKIRLDTGEIQPKAAVYEALLRAMFDDQLDWLADRTRVRKIDARNAVESLATATNADRMATRLVDRGQ